MSFCLRCGADQSITDPCPGWPAHAWQAIPEPATVYCRRCGMSPGEPASCTHHWHAHDWILRAGEPWTLVCHVCGKLPAGPAECLPHTSSHEWLELNQDVALVCERCEAAPGEPVACRSPWMRHSWAEDPS
jgi:hypothetical protein